MRSRVLAAAAAGVVMLTVLVLLSGGAGGDDHRLRAQFDNAIQMVAGQEVRMAGRKVGEIADVELADGRALVDLRIEDDDVWPLPKGTIARARWGSTTAYLGRYTELVPGPASGGSLPDGGILGRERTSTAFELDEAYLLMRGRTKHDTGKLLDRLGETLDGRADELSQGLAAAPAGLDETAALLREFSADEERLRTLAVAGDRTVSALAGREADLRGLVEGAAGTFAEFAEHTRAQQVALERAPRTFAQTTDTLARLDRSVDGLDALVGDLRPGAPALRRMARPAARALAALKDIAPLATSTLDRGAAAAPRLRELFAAGTPFLPRLGRALGAVEPMMACLRPYAPEIAGFLSTWTGVSKNYDATGHYGRTFPLTYVPSINPGTLNTSLQATTLTPRLKYAMPRPPGLNAGKPWFQPQCGAGPEALDPAKDPEGAGR